MHRTQIYLDEALFETVRQKATKRNLSIFAYIREVLQKGAERRTRTVGAGRFLQLCRALGRL